jgi:hypothetical protein
MSKDKQQPSGGPQTQADWNNHADNLNPNNDNFWKSRGYPERPEDWETAVPEPKHPNDQDK